LIYDLVYRPETEAPSITSLRTTLAILAATAVNAVSQQFPAITRPLPPMLFQFHQIIRIYYQSLSRVLQQDFIETNVTNSTVQTIFEKARAAPFISYDAEFENIIGNNASISLVAERNNDLFAFEAGLWVPKRNEVWFSSSTYTPPTYISVLNLATLEITQPA
jgi:hypothetical protein